jgi:rhombotail lipoprotein
MKTLVLMLVLGLCAACVTQSEVRRRSDLMSYLYPNASSAPMPQPGKARMQLPLRMGIAFVPSTADSVRPVVPRQDEAALLNVVRKTFEGRDWVQSIVIIPSAYLTPHGGFENLDQVARMYGVEVIALASVDQIQYVNMTQIAYISIVGNLFLPLDRNETKTLIDVAVFHVPSRTFLLRAPGASSMKGYNNAVEEPKVLRDRALQGLRVATTDLSKNLDSEVAEFKSAIVAGERQEIEIVNQKGVNIRTSGSFRWFEALIALLCAALALTPEALRGEPWRLWTAHLVHYDFAHLFFNAIALVAPLLLLRRQQWRAVALWAALAAPCISIAIIAAVPNVEYRGGSALVVGVWILAPLANQDRSVSALILACIMLKLALEALTPFHLTSVSVPALPLAHAAGALAGLLGLPIVHRFRKRIESTGPIPQIG